MLILVHVVLAITALALSVLNFFKPSVNRMKTSYWIAGGTLSSGVLLIIVNHANILRTCLSGLLFFAVVSCLNELGRHRLAPESME